MEAGREMDALVAEKVFGFPKWEPFIRSVIPHEPCGTSLDGCPYDKSNHFKYFNETKLKEERNIKHPKPYSISISAAWEVVEEMWQRGWWSQVGHQCIDGTWEAEFMPGSDKLGNQSFCALAPAAPLAICRAALKAVEGGDAQ